MEYQVVSDEILCMWQAYQRMLSVWPMIENPEGQLNCAIIDNVSQGKMITPESVAAFGNYVKFMMSSTKLGILQHPTEQSFTEWYHKGDKCQHSK